jgi:hypothetical protein
VGLSLLRRRCAAGSLVEKSRSEREGLTAITAPPAAADEMRASKEGRRRTARPLCGSAVCGVVLWVGGGLFAADSGSGDSDEREALVIDKTESSVWWVGIGIGRLSGPGAERLKHKDSWDLMSASVMGGADASTRMVISQSSTLGEADIWLGKQKVAAVRERELKG